MTKLTRERLEEIRRVCAANYRNREEIGIELLSYVDELGQKLAQAQADAAVLRESLNYAHGPEGCYRADKALSSTSAGAELLNAAREAIGALNNIKMAYERVIRSRCNTPEAINAEPWRCSEFVGAEQMIQKLKAALGES